jgi:hypothetical protein
MDKRSEYLSTLGLPPNASWDEVAQAYKDLMRVWHPDRFQSDERLRKKAEEQAQRINHAMGELKKLGKEGFEHSHVKPSPTPKATASRPRTNGTAHSSSQGPRPGAQFAQASYTNHSIAPLQIGPKIGSMLLRMCVAIAVMYLASDSLRRPFANPQQEAFTVSIIFVALDLGSRSLLMLLASRPLITVDRAGLFLLKTGRLGWLDIESVWPVITPRFSHLSVRLSPSYVAKQGLLTRAFFFIRRLGNPAHITVPFSGLASDPVQVVNAMKLFQTHSQLSLVETKPVKTTAILITQALAAACCAVPVVRCLLEGGLSTTEYVIYFILFLIVRIIEFALRIGRSQQAEG